jgi:uncharacterized protein YlxW (UPF0749 family)
MATMIQQELKAQTPEEELEELYEEEPRRRPWGAIISVVLALAVIFVGYQWQQGSAREHMLRSQAHALRADAETLRLRAEEAQREIEGLQKRLAAAGAERQGLVERVMALERQSQEQAAAIARAAEARSAAREKARATPVVSKPRR